MEIKKMDVYEFELSEEERKAISQTIDIVDKLYCNLVNKGGKSFICDNWASPNLSKKRLKGWIVFLK